MAKLSRTARFQELRDQLDQETTVAQTTPGEQIKLTRSNRIQNKALHANDVQPSVNESPKPIQTSTVMDELLGEVKQYNIDNGDRAAQDTQINILKTLDTNSQSMNSRRNAHMETMEPNEDAGGTTMNVMKQNVDALFGQESRTEPVTTRPARKTALDEKDLFNTDILPMSTVAPAREEKEEIILEETPEEDDNEKTKAVEINLTDLIVDEPVDHDQLEMFDLGADDFDRTIRQSQEQPAKYASRREMKKARKKARVNEEKSMQTTEKMSDAYSSVTERIHYDDIDSYDEEPSPKSKASKAGNIILSILIVLLIIAIAATLYMIYSTGIF
ncbi:hypothetical protein [Ileibacterium valens]|uniref:hypothetical protein n=1 Tax=Ileibacterium valens TaxID=1862668 RepID=UPI002357789F|nr:hypothetical protein [Ileibacterium valens]